MAALPPNSGLSAAAYRAQYDLAFQTAPILLQNGIAAKAQGGLLPITSLWGGSTDFAKFLPLPGSNLISQAVATYPFASQTVAANATIQEPLTVSLIMIAPVNQPGGYLTKLQAFSALQNSLAQHNAAGGTYIVATPAFVYQNLLMTAMTDVTERGEQQQIEWQLDFVQPLLTQAAAQAAQNALMQKISGGGKLIAPFSWSGQQAASPATLTGVTGALATFTGGQSPTTPSVAPTLSGNPAATA